MNKKYEIKELLDFAKIPADKLVQCLSEFIKVVEIMQLLKKKNIRAKIEFIWIDDGKKNLNVKISGKKAKQ